MRHEVLALGVAIVFAAVSWGDELFTNPVLAQDWPDPALWQADGAFYSVATGLRTVFRSDNAVDWSDTGVDPLTPDARRKLMSISGHLWAPCVLRLGEEWLLYVSLFVSDLDCRIEVLSSKSPIGPFEHVGEVVNSRTIGILNTIDPHVLKADGKVWMFFGSCQDGVHRVELTADGRAVGVGAKPVHVAGLRNPGPSGKKPYTNIWCKPGTYEGAFLLRRHGWWYLFVSGGKYSDHTYYLTAGRSRTIDGEFRDRDGFPMTAGVARPILSSEKGDELYGPGHNGEVVTSDDGRDFVFFHCHDAGRPANERPTFLQELKWTEDAWPSFESGRPRRTERKFRVTHH